MAVPTITSVTPSAGTTGGRLLVEIAGTDFQLPPAPAATGPTTPPNPSVEVLFGDKVGFDVQVVSSTRLFVVNPTHDAGPVDVTVRNVDQDGAVVPGETATATAAFTYGMPSLAADAEATLARVVRMVIRELKRQVLENVVLTVHVDYDDTTGDSANVAMLTQLPGLVLAGPEIRENRMHEEQDARYNPADDPGTWRQLRPAMTVDLIFTLTGASDKQVVVLNLMAQVLAFFRRNPRLYMLAKPDDPSLGSVHFEMALEPGGFPKASPVETNSNVRSFSATFAVKGLAIEEQDMTEAMTAETGDEVSDVSAGYEQFGG